MNRAVLRALPTESKTIPRAGGSAPLQQWRHVSLFPSPFTHYTESLLSVIMNYRILQQDSAMHSRSTLWVRCVCFAKQVK